MPKILRLHETAEKMVKRKIPVFFERWNKRPWGIAIHLRGLNKLLIDTLRNPDIIHKLLSFIADSRIRWEREKATLLLQKIFGYRPH